MGLQERQQVPLKEQPRQKERPPQPHYHGTLVRPENLKLPGGEKATAAFNAAWAEIPNPVTGQSESWAVYRVMVGNHEENKPDMTKYFGIQRFVVTPDGVQGYEPSFLPAEALLGPHDKANNPEDMRLTTGPHGEIVGGLTEATTIAKPDGTEQVVPMIAIIEGQPVYKGDGSGEFATVQFNQAVLVTQEVHGIKQPIYGKNVQVEFDPNTGERLVRYRPEYLDDAAGVGKVINRTQFRTLREVTPGNWQPIEVGNYPTDAETLARILPEGYTLGKFGLNGAAITGPNGETFRVDHVAMKAPDGKDEYAFITVDGQIKPFTNFDAINQLSGGEEEDLTGDKRVIYSNGAKVKWLDGRQVLVQLITKADKSIIVGSTDLAELEAYATSDEEQSISTRSRRGRGGEIS